MLLLVSTFLGWTPSTSLSTGSTSPHNWPKTPRPLRSLYLNGVRILRMYSLKRHTIFSLHIVPMTTLLISNHHSHQRPPRCIPWTQRKMRPVVPSLMNILLKITPSSTILLCSWEGWFPLPCQDYCYLNSHTICNTYPLPLIPELIDDMKDSTFFTKFNIQGGYNNIHIQETDQWKAAFITPFRLFEPTIMFFGFCNAPSMFQAFINRIFANTIAEWWLKIYMDDLGIHTQGDIALHHEHTCWVLLCLCEHGLSLKLSKCLFNTPKMEFLGIIIG